MKVLVVGHSEPAAALTSALCEQGLDAELHAAPRHGGTRGVEPLVAAFTDLEARLRAERPDLTVAVGTGDAPLALVVTAAKLGVPVVAWAERGSGAGDRGADERRVLATLADFDAGAVGDGLAAFAAAERIAAWART